MKKTISTIILAALIIIGASAFITKKSATGYAGYTGSPGEQTCSGGGACHGGGSSSVSGITITSVPAFSVNGNSDTEYLPDSTYQINLTVSAAGFTRYGFDCEILDINSANAGTMQNPGSGVKFLNAFGRRNAVHSTPKIAATGIASFTFKWKAPVSSTGDATIYAIANAVNGNGTTSGDFVLSPVTKLLVEGTPPPPPIDTTSTVGVKEIFSSVSKVSVFPNPANDITNISYNLSQPKTITIQLIDIKGNVIKQLYNQENEPGFHTQILNLQGIASGVYFIKTSADQQKVSQKLITVQ